MNKNRLIAVLSAVMILIGNVYATAPKREFRSAWVTTVWGIDWPAQQGTSASVVASQKADLIALLDAVEDMNLTTVCFQVRGMSDAMYESSYEPWSKYISGTRGLDPGWDPLAFAVEECHKRGIELYAWVNPFRWASSGSDTYWTTEFDTKAKSDGWLMTNGSYTVLNPGIAEVRTHIVNVCKEIITKYNVEGLIFDDYFYPSGGTSEGTDAPDYSLWKNSGTSMTIGDWRRNNVNTAIKEIYNMIQANRPEVRFGIAPPGTAGASASNYGLSMWTNYNGRAGYDGQYTSLYADPLYWMANNIIDFVSPQVYWHNDHTLASFGSLASWWYDCTAKLGDVHCNMSVDISDLITPKSYQEDLGNTTAHYQEHVDNIEQSREYAANSGLNAYGSNFFSVKYLYGDYAAHGQYLRDNCFQTKALVPVVDWKTAKTYSAVSNPAYSSGTLTWDAVTDGLSTIRYTVYAIPSTITPEAVKTSDGIDHQYLLGVTYANTYSLPTDKQSGYWYAVCVYDGYGNEHEAAYVNYSIEKSEKVTLTSPVGGAVASWNTIFSWSAVTGATYRLDIASDNAFTDIKYQEYNLTANSATLDLYLLEDAKTYYWRVVCTESGKQSTTSDVATFTAPTRTAAPVAGLVSPAESAQVEEDITFKWTTASGVESYKLEISSSNDFSTLKLSYSLSSSSAATLSQVVHIAELSKGTYYWRVVASANHYTPSYSDVRSFEVTKETVGLYESGYEIVLDKDNDSYAMVGSVSVNSLWYRSVTDDYANITFELDGSYNRSMCAVGDYVYVSGRSANDYSSSTKVYLRKFNGRTGEIIEDLELGSEALVHYNPCNDVVKDSKDNVCIANLVLSPSDNPLVVHWVNLETGALTQVASVKVTGVELARIDNIAITGDVSTGNFKLYAARESSIIRWTFEDGTKTKEEVCTVKAYYPTKSGEEIVSVLGTAPYVSVIDDNSIFVDGGNTAWSRYDFSTGNMTDSFDNNVTLKPTSCAANGGTYFTIGGKKYVTYSASDYSDENYPPHTFNLVSADDDMSFASMSKMWTLPKAGLGSVNTTGQQAVADYVQVSDHAVILYYYVPGNGICAYEIIDEVASGISDVTTSQKLAVNVSAGKIGVGAVAQSIDVYSVMGARVAHAENTAVVETGVAPGLYVVVAVIDGETYTEKILIK